MISMMSYQSGVDYGEKNAEKIREQKKEQMDPINDSVAPKYVTVNTYKNDSVPVTVHGYGRVVSTSTINVTTEVQGKLSSKIQLKKGEKFSKGQVLFTLNDSDARLALQARKSNFLSLITSILPDLKIDYPDNYQNWSDFFDNIMVNRPLPNMPNFKSFKEKNFIVSRNILSEYFNIRSDEERLRKYVITAPFDGSIIDAFTDEGAIVGPGSPVISIIRNGEMEIEISISKDDVDQVKIDAQAKLTDENSKSYTGKVSRIGDYINQQTQTVPVFIAIDQTSDNLFNGMYLDGSIECSGFENVIEIPRKALINNKEVYTVQKGLLTTTSIEVKSFKDNSVIVSGVKDNVPIVIEPVLNAKENMEVETIMAK